MDSDLKNIPLAPSPNNGLFLKSRSMRVLPNLQTSIWNPISGFAVLHLKTPLENQTFDDIIDFIAEIFDIIRIKLKVTICS